MKTESTEFERQWWRELLLLAAVLVLIGLAGCTQGQLAPGAIKDLARTAQADAKITASEIRQQATTLPIAADPITQAVFWRAQRDALLECLDRLAGTPADRYQDGYLPTLVHWFDGTRPPAAEKGSGQ